MHKEPLIVKKPFERIAIRANWFRCRIFLVLERADRRIDSKDIFGEFDHSYCQSDIELDKE